MLTSERQSLEATNWQKLDKIFSPVWKCRRTNCTIKCLNLIGRLNCPTVLDVQRLVKKLSFYNVWLDFILKTFLYTESSSNTKYLSSISWRTLDVTAIRLSLILQKQLLFFPTLHRTHFHLPLLQHFFNADILPHSETRCSMFFLLSNATPL
jgi:hypothetical protein